MPYRYLDHSSEVGVLATGATAEETIADAARGLFGIQVSRAGLAPARFVEVSGTGEDLPGCLVDFLNALLAKQDLAELVFVDVTSLRLAAGGDGHVITASAGGIPAGLVIDHRQTEVKAVTYYGLKFHETPDGWLIRYVADV